jgi:hypothetical protein
VAAHSGAEVAAIDVAVPYVENFSTEAQPDDDFALDIMLRHGIPEDVAAALQSVSQAFRGWGAPVHVTRTLRDGEPLALRDRTSTYTTAPVTRPRTRCFMTSSARC